jgi:Family of unknown function (DUF6364)
MKQKLTLTVERAAVQAARRAAHRQGTSISAIFEKTFAAHAAPPTPGFAERWLKQRRAEGVRPIVPIPSDHRFEYLRKKYLKPAP